MSIIHEKNCWKPEDTIRLADRICRVRSAAIRGRRGLVYQVEDEGGNLFAFKMAADQRRENLLSLSREVRKNRRYHRWGLPHAEIIEAGDGWVLKRWVAGVRGDEWVRAWARAGFPPSDLPWRRLVELLRHSTRRRIYLRDLNQNNLIWDGAGWVIIDAGSVRRYLRRGRVLRLYLAELPREWGRAAGAGGEEILRRLLTSALPGREN